jgi:hypothetical protein
MTRSTVYQTVFCGFALRFITQGLTLVSYQPFYDHVTAADFARQLYATGISHVAVGFVVILSLRHVPRFTNDA